MRNMEEGQAAALGRAAIAEARTRGAEGGDGGRRRIICGVICGVIACVAAFVCFFVFIDTGSSASSSGTVKVATTPSPVAAPTPSPVAGRLGYARPNREPGRDRVDARTDVGAERGWRDRCAWEQALGHWLL